MKKDPLQSRKLTWIGVNVVLTLVLLLSMAGAGFFSYQWYRERQIGQGLDAAVAAARQTVVDLLTISASSVDKDLAQVSQGATGNFKEQFEAEKPKVKTTVIENKVDSKGKVLRAGLVSGDSDSAIVLVAVDAKVKNANAPKGRKAHYRIQVDMSYDQEPDRWLVAELKFVG